MFEEDRRAKPADPLERVTSRDVEKLAPAGVFGYSAGKSIIAKKLVKLFPEHKAYTEPFCGSAALFFTKQATPVEALNDRNENVAFALRAIKTISKSDLAELGAKDWVGDEATFKRLKASDPQSKVDRLYKFLYLINFSYGKNERVFNPGARGQVARSASRVERAQKRMTNTVVTCGDYEKTLQKHDSPDAFHFIDPPYGGYNRQGIGEKEFDEARFRKALEALKGRFLVTYGTKGQLDVSGFEVKRMRQARTIRHMDHVGGAQYLTHLLISNYKSTTKSLGSGIEIDDVVSVIDTEGGAERIMITGSRTSVSVPEAIAPPSVLKGAVHVRFFEKVCKIDLTFKSGEENVSWTFDTRRADVVGDERDVAKSFSVNGSRFFLPMTEGVRAAQSADEVLTKMIAIDRPIVELGIQTETMHEYFLSKGDELAGVLLVQKDPDSLASQYPWIATYIDRFPSALSDFTVLKNEAPLPPFGVSALPSSLERFVPADMRYWTMKGEEAFAARSALIASKLLSSENLAIVDGEFMRIAHKIALDDSLASIAPARADWTLEAVATILPATTTKIHEVFSPDKDAIAKAEAADSIVFCDAGDALDGTLDMLAKSLSERPSGYVVCAMDAPSARESLFKMGRVFKFRPSASIPSDAVKRIFVASLPIASDVDWIKKDFQSGPPGPGEREDDPVLALYSEPSDDTADLGKAEWTTAYVDDLPDSAFLFVEAGDKDEDGKTKPRSLRHFPVKDKDGNPDPAHVRNALARIPQAKVPPSAKADAIASAQRMLAQLKKDDLTTGGPGFLLPAQGFKPHRQKKSFVILDKKDDEKDEQIVYGIVLEPDTVDAQQDIYSAEEVRTAAHKYMADFQNAGLMHQKTINDKAKVIESYLAPCDFTLGGQKVIKGTWVMAMQILDAKVWQEAKSGGLTGFSIGGSAQRTPEPTSKAMRKTQHKGVPITIDRPKGYVQTGRDAEGKSWEREYKVDYGYIPRTKGGDGEGIDVFVGPNPDADTTYWVAQKKADGSFDEYKVIVGADSSEEAKKIYLDHVPEKYFGGMSEMSVEQMKALLNKEPEHKMQPEASP